MGYISVDSYEERLKITEKNNIISSQVVQFKPTYPAKSNGIGVMPIEVTSMIGALGIVEGRRETARNFGMKHSQVENYSDGKVEIGGEVRQEALDAVKEKVNLLRGKIENKIDKIVDCITEDKIINAKAIELASMAAQLSKIPSNLHPEEKNNNTVNNNGMFIFFRPRQREEDEYEQICVNE
jgi:acylphosphatase